MIFIKYSKLRSNKSFGNIWLDSKKKCWINEIETNDEKFILHMTRMKRIFSISDSSSCSRNVTVTLRFHQVVFFFECFLLDLMDFSALTLFCAGFLITKTLILPLSRDLTIIRGKCVG